jgi:translation elongation factor EF-4
MTGDTESLLLEQLRVLRDQIALLQAGALIDFHNTVKYHVALLNRQEKYCSNGTNFERLTFPDKLEERLFPFKNLAVLAPEYLDKLIELANIKLKEVKKTSHN